MSGKKGRSGRISGELKTWCESVIREHALPKMLTCLQHDSPTTERFRWCVEQLAKLGQLYAPVQHEHSGTIEVADAARRFESRVDRLAARLGAAGMPEWPAR